MDSLTKVASILKREGPIELVKRSGVFLYNRNIAPLLPRTEAVYNGVDVRAARYFDSVLPWRSKNKPHYESGLISGIEDSVTAGDEIVIVGGGWGVTPVKAARETGNSGRVTVFEGSSEKLDHVRETARINNVIDRIDVVHAVVGPQISLRGRAGQASRIAPEELPECDVLELDCEGSEIEILNNLTIEPRVILVESHGVHGAPSSKIEELLNDLSYSVESKEVANSDMEDFCEEQDIYILKGIHE